MEDPRIPPETDAAVGRWMKSQGWEMAPARWHMEPEAGFYIWQEASPRQSNAHTLWVAESMVQNLAPQDLVAVLDREGIAESLRISFRIRIEERGTEFRTSVVPRRSGEFRIPQ